jgi:predicted carbohydrate-binding protein with CBM5 and CBM33 domain
MMKFPLPENIRACNILTQEWQINDTVLACYKLEVVSFIDQRSQGHDNTSRVIWSSAIPDCVQVTRLK